MSEFSQIACEICRTKKRKCDRQIPTCSQCIHTNQTCTYPGTSKRGLPSGYIASIEERLAQTEAALLQALSTIHASQIQKPNLSPATNEKPRDMEYNEVRIAKVEEWQRYPLDTLEHQQAWVQHKLATDGARISIEPAHHTETPNLSNLSHQSQDRQQSDPARKRQKTVFESQETMIPRRKNDATESTATPTLFSPAPAAGLSDGVEVPPNLFQTDSKAKRLSTLQSQRYF